MISPSGVRRYRSLSLKAGVLATLAFFTLPVLHSPAVAQPSPILKAADARSVPRDQIRQQKIPAVLEGQVTFARATWNTYMVQDETAGICFWADSITNRLTPGDRIRIHGYLGPGRYAPIVVITNLVELEKGTLPPARPARVAELLAGAEDAQRVSLSGIIGHSAFGRNHTRWTLQGEFGSLGVTFPSRITPPDGTNWIGARVHVSGVCISELTDQDRFVGPQLIVQGIEDVRILEAPVENPFRLPHVPIERVLEFTPSRDIFSQLRTEGIVTAVIPGRGFYIQSDQHALHVEPAEPAAVPTGARVEVVGFPKSAGGSPRLENARFNILGSATLPPPVEFSLTKPKAALDGILVTLECILRETTPFGGAQEFDVRDPTDPALILTVRPDGSSRPATREMLESGSRLRLSGILDLSPTGKEFPGSARLHLRSWDEVMVLQPGPWWNTERASLTVILLGFVVAGGMTWSATLRRRLDEQRRLLEDQLSQRLTLERRHRELTEGAPDSIYTLDAQGRILTVNPAAATLMGRPEAELRTMSILDLVAPDEKERVRTRLRERFSGGTDPGQFEVDIVTAQGQRRSIEVASRVLRPPAGPPILEGVGRDITERRRAQEALKTLLATTAVASGEELFQIIVRRLADVLKVNTVFIGVFDGPARDHVQMIASWMGGEPGILARYPIQDTPCMEVIGRTMQTFPRKVQESFPSAACLRELQAESYVGVPLWDSSGNPIGVLGVVHSSPFEPDPSQIDMLRILAARAGAELDRVRATTALQASEERFRELADQTRDILWVADLTSGRLAYLSPSFSRLSALPVAEVCRRPRRIIRQVPPEDRSRVFAALRKALREPSGRYSTEYRIRRADGTLGWILDEGVVIRSPEGRPQRLSGVARDITSRKEAELALAAERERFRNLFENSPDSIFVESTSGTVLDVNRAACELHGKTRERLVGCHISDLVPLRHRESVSAGLSRLVSGELTRYEGWSLRSDGIEVPVELRIGRIQHEGQDALFVHARDITSRRDAQELLDGQKRILEWIATGRHVETVLAELLRVIQARWRSARCGIHWLPSPADSQLRVVSPSSGSGTAVLLGELSKDGGAVLNALASVPSDNPTPAPAAPTPFRTLLESTIGPRLALIEPMLGADGRPLGAVTAIVSPDVEPLPDQIELLRLAGSLGGVALQRYRSDTALREGSDRLRIANAALLSLASKDSVANGDLDRALEEITEAAARGLGVRRTNVWMLDESKSLLQCVHAYGEDSGERTEGIVIRAVDFPSYFGALSRERFVSVVRADRDPRTAELFPAYLRQRGIVSTLDAGIRLGGGLVGVICHEHQGPPRTWSNEEELFAGSLADLVAQTLQASQRKSTEDALRQSEEAYGSVASVLAEGVMIVNRDLSFGTFNDSAANILGHSRDFLESHRLDEIEWETIRPDHTPLPFEEYPLSITFRTAARVTDSIMGVRRPDGNWVWLSINTGPFARNEDGSVASVLVSFADVTSRHTAERELRRGTELLESIRQVQANFISDADPSRNLRHMLTSIAHATGSSSGIIGEVTHGTDGREEFRFCAALDMPSNSAMRSGEETRVTELMHMALRQRDTVAHSASGISDNNPTSEGIHRIAIPLRMDDAILGVAGLARFGPPYQLDEIRKLDPLLLTCASLFSAIRTARRRQEAEAQIRKLNAELEARVEERTADLKAMNEELAEFAYVVTHDLKAPLRGIHQLAEWLTHDHAFGLDENGLKLLALLRRRVLHLQRLVDGLLACARVGRSPEPETAVSVGQLLHDVVGVLAPPPQVRIDLPDSLPTIQGNPERLHQIFQNLLDNAIKYLDKPDGVVRVVATRIAGAWEFRVIDNGPGIPQRYWEKVFQIFQRLDARGDIPGTGLGLTLVRRIIEARGGRAWIESTEGKGTSVCFTWPDRARRRPE